MRKPTNSIMWTASRMRWPRPTVSSYCAQSGIRDVISLLGKVPDKRSLDRLECWVWDQVYNCNAIPVLSLAMCMVIDVVFPVSEKRCHQSCWVGALIANLLAALGVARLRVASQHAYPPRWTCRVLRMLPPKWLQGISDPSGPLLARFREACSVTFPASGFGASVVYVLAGHSGVYVGQARLDRKKMCGMGPRALEHLRALLYTNVRDGMKPRYRILRRSLGSVFMLPAFWCDSVCAADRSPQCAGEQNPRRRCRKIGEGHRNPRRGESSSARFDCSVEASSGARSRASCWSSIGFLSGFRRACQEAPHCCRGGSHQGTPHEEYSRIRARARVGKVGSIARRGRHVGLWQILPQLSLQLPQGSKCL